MAGERFAFLREPLEPRGPVGDDFLKLFGGEALVPVVAAEEQQVIDFFCVHNFG
jgi:hypothetical protein